MTTPTPPLTPAAAAYRKWYAKHKAEFNRKRAEKYAADEGLRQAAQRKQQLYRETKPREVASGQHFRMVKGHQVEVFRIGSVSEMIGRNEQTIRSWERKGYIPKPTIKSTHRFYTTKQVQLLREFGDLSSLVRWDPQIRAVAISKKVKEIKAQWAGV